jgi:hypothetical protein
MRVEAPVGEAETTRDVAENCTPRRNSRNTMAIRSLKEPHPIRYVVTCGKLCPAGHSSTGPPAMRDVVVDAVVNFGLL